MIDKNSEVYKLLRKNYQGWEIEEMLEDPEIEEEFFDPWRDYGIHYQGEI